jgi:hypothetical protein
MVRQGRWKLIRSLDSETIELHDLSKDIGEERNVSAENAALANELNKAAFAWLKQTGAPMMKPNPDYDPETKPRKQDK